MMKTMGDEMNTERNKALEAAARVQKYLDQRMQSRGLDKEHITGMNVGDEKREAVLLVSDLQTLLLAAAPSPVAQPDYNGEEWELLAMALAAEEHDDIHALIYEGGPIPEPWGEVWQKYEDDAKRMIEFVRKHVPTASPVAQDERLDPHFILQLAGGKLSFDSQSGLVAFANTVIAEYKARAATPAQDKQAGSQQEAVDAARYRFLRDGEWRDTDLERYIVLQLNTLWDAKISAAMQAQGERNG